MKSYFIPGLSKVQKEKLSSKGIAFYDFTLSDQAGAILEESALQPALAVLEAEVSKQDATTYQGILRIEIEERNPLAGCDPAGPKVSLGVWNGANKKGMASVAARVLLPHLRQDIVLSNPRQVITPIEDGQFHIHIYSSTKPDNNAVHPPAHIWGLPVECQEHAWHASGSGIAIRNENSQYAVAEVVGKNNLYIHHNLVKTGSEYEEQIFALVLERALDIIAPLQSRERARRLFVEECCKSSTSALLAAGQGPKVEHGEKIRQLNKDLQGLLRAGQEAESRLLRNDSHTHETFGEEYDALLKIKKVKDVSVENGAIVVYTDVLYARGPRTGNIHEIGAMKIILNPARISPLWFNQTRVVHGMRAGQHAPHVWANGEACLGTTEVVFKRLFQGRQWAIAAQLAIEFVETVNSAANYYPQGVPWPVASQGQDSSVTPTEGQLNNQTKTELDAQHQQYRQEYIRACASRLAELIKEDRQAIVTLRNRVEAIQIELVHHIQASRIESTRTAGRKFCDREEFAREIDRMLNMPKVVDVQIGPGVINVFTDTLYCAASLNQARREIGRLRIKIYTDGQADSVRWFNLTRSIDGCLKNQQAPYVLSSGRARFSEIRESFPDLIANMQFSIVAQLAIDFIEQTAVDDPDGKQLTRWPAAAE